MSKIKKADQKKFNDSIIQLCKQFEGKSVLDPYMAEIYLDQYEFKTICGTLVVTIVKDQTICYTIFSRFTEGFKMEIFKQNFSTQTFNQFSHKWNLHEMDGDYIIDTLEKRLTILHGK